MILKNCYIYDSKSGKEVLTDFYIKEKIIDYSENLAEKIKASDFIETDMFSLTPAIIERANKGDEKIIIDAKGLIT